MRFALICTLLACAAQQALCAPGRSAPGAITAWVHTRDGRNIIGSTADSTLSIEVDGKTRRVPLHDLLSFNNGAPVQPSSSEASKIAGLLVDVNNADHKVRDKAIVELTDIGIPAMSQLLATYKDVDAHEPQPAYRLFARLVPGYADSKDRTLDLIRLANGETLRGKTQQASITLTTSDGKEVTVSTSDLWKLAIRRKQITKTFELHALRHTTPIEFLDAGIAVVSDSTVEESSEGYVRLSFDIDGWSSDPDGLKVPGPNYKTNLVDGFPFGALVGRVGAEGPRWLAGKSVKKNGIGSATPDHLQLAVNDNGHWQNNIGSFRVKLKVTDAYDIGDPQ